METKKVEKLEPGRNYKVNLDEKNSFVIVNDAVIHKDVIHEITFLQGIETYGALYNNSGYESVAVFWAELFSYMAFSAEYTDQEEKVMKLLHELQMQFSTIKNLSLPQNLIQKLSKQSIDKSY